MTALADAPTVDVSALKPISSKAEVADFLGASVDYVNQLMRTSQLGYYKRGESKQATVRIGREHVAALLRSWERCPLVEVADVVGLSVRQLRRMSDAGELGAYQLRRPADGKRGGALRVAESDLIALADRMKI